MRVVCECEEGSIMVSSSGCAQLKNDNGRMEGEGWSGGCGRSVPSHQKLLNPCIDALHGLLNEKRVGRVQTAVAVSKKPTSYSVVVCGPGL